MSSYNLHNAELLIARFNDARATALEVAGQLPAAHDEIRALRASLRAMRADLEQSVSRHKMCQENLASACAERDQLRAERDALAMRRDELLVTVRNLSLQTPYPEEERNAAVLIAEVGTLKARVAEVERERDAAVRERDEAVLSTQMAIAGFVHDRLDWDRSSDAALYAIAFDIEQGKWKESK